MQPRATARSPVPLRFLGLLSALCITLFCAAARADAPPPQPSNDPASAGAPAIRVFSDKDGVALGSVPTLTYDSFGRLWIGTEAGPSYYDGKTWTHVTMPPDAQWTSALAAGSDGSVWIGTQANGVFRYHQGTVESHAQGLPSNRIFSLLVTESNEGMWVWAGTDKGLARTQGTGWEVFDTTNSPLPDNLVKALAPAVSAPKAVWVGTGTGLARLESGQWQVHRAGASSFPQGEIGALLETKDGQGRRTLWVGTYRGLARLRDQQWTVFRKDNSGLPSDMIWSLAETRDATGRASLWIGTYGAGLTRWEAETWTTFDARSSDFPNNYVLALQTSPQNSEPHLLWAGTSGGGLVRLRLDGWRSVTPRRDNLSEAVWNFAQSGPTGQPSFWIATQQGANRFEQGQWTHFDPSSSGLPGAFVLALSPSTEHEGAMWAGTHDGLALFREGQWTTFATQDNGLPSNMVRCLLDSPRPNGPSVLWVGTNRGLARFEDGAWKTFNTQNSGLSADSVLSLLETQSSEGKPVLWVGTTGGGLSRFEEGRWTRFGTDNSALPSNQVLSLAELRSPTGKRILWAGTASAGAVRFALDQPSSPWTLLSSKTNPSLPDDVIYQIVQDPAGSVYLLTNRGVARLVVRDSSRDDNDAYTLESYTAEDGLPGNEGNARAAFVDREGRVWAGTTMGAAVFQPERRGERSKSPKSQLLLNAARLSETGDELVSGQSLAWNQNTIGFDYSLASLFRESETRFSTQLVGFDEAPSQWTADGKTRYTNLPPGDYEFKVWGKDWEGNVAGPLAVSFRVRPAPWRTIWAYLAYGILLIGAGFGIFMVRVRTLQRRTRWLEAQVQKRTEELREKNRELDSKNTRLEAARSEADRQNLQLAEANRELLESNYRADRIFSALAEALPGTVLDGKYRLDKRIGTGGFAAVFQGRHLPLDRTIAIKVFRPMGGNDSARDLERFRREGPASCRVDHPNAIQVFDSGMSEDGIAYLVMELLQGCTLSQALKRQPVLSLRRCVEIVQPICRALAKAHEEGIIHRDIKPANIFLHETPQGEVVKVLDFGIAKALGARDPTEATLTDSGNLLGTPVFMAPERFRNTVVDPRSDVYSVAVMVYKMISGTFPYVGDACAILIKQVTERPQPLREVAPHVPVEISEIVMRGMSKDVRDRPTAAEFERLFSECVLAQPAEVQDAVNSSPNRTDRGLESNSDADTVSDTSNSWLDLPESGSTF